MKALVPITQDYFNFTVNSTITKNSNDYSRQISQKSGNEFVFIRASMKNLGSLKSHFSCFTLNTTVSKLSNYSSRQKS
jgi:hypothetical protein